MKTDLRTIFTGFFFAIILSSCGGEITPERQREIENEVNTISAPENPDHNKLIGRWQLDSLIQPSTMYGITLKKSEVSKNARLEDSKLISYFQKKYKNSTDKVQIDEFTTDGKHITTSIDKFSIKKSGKHITETNYSIQDNTIYETWRWGANLQNENSSNSKIVKVDADILIYEFKTDNQILTFYFSKIQN